MGPLRVGLVQYRDARDVRNWSGTLSFSKAAIDRHVGPVVDLSPAPVSFMPFRVARKLVRSATATIFDEWSIADAELAFALQRLVVNSEPVPEPLAGYVAAQWSRPSIRAFVDQPRPTKH